MELLSFSVVIARDFALRGLPGSPTNSPGARNGKVLRTVAKRLPRCEISRIFSALLGTAIVPAIAQDRLPDIDIGQSVQAPLQTTTQKHIPLQSTGQPTTVGEEQELASKNKAFDAARDQILPKIGTNTYEFDRETIETLPQASNASVGTLLQQAPGVNQNSAVSFEGPVHVRLEHGFIQYRINGILLPDGATGFTQILDTAFINNLALVTGALPAQYGFRTSGLVDITTRSGFTQGGEVGVYGGGREVITPYFNYGGTVGSTEYFVTGRYFQSREGIENPTSSVNAIHDNTGQEKFFGYASTLLDDSARLTFISGSSLSRFQVPNNPAQVPTPGSLPVPGLASFDSSRLNERQFEQNFYNVVAVQKKVDNLDAQLSYFSRYSDVHFIPDPLGDLYFNNVASDVLRSSFLNGVQGDGAYRVNEWQTLRLGFTISAEQTKNYSSSLVLSTGGGGACGSLPGCTIDDGVTKLGWLLGTYVQDELKLADKVILNTGLRFDQMWQFVDANQLSPRASLVVGPFDGATLHAGYARYFTPASQLLSAQPNLALYQNTTQQPVVPQADPVRPERAHYFDVGVEQALLPGLVAGIDGYYKIARNQIDVGQFGQALVLDEYNYEKGYNEGVEFKVKYQEGNFKAYANMAWAQQFATNVTSQQYLFDPSTLAYIATHKIYTDLSQRWTGSAGASYLWQDTRFSADLIYGSGLRAGFANTQSMSPYAQINVGLSHELKLFGDKPTILRFDVVNPLDTIYELRNGTGIGVFAPQYGPRRGFFGGIAQKF